MKILFVLGSTYPGAAWTRIQHFASYFSRLGHNSVIFARIAHLGKRNRHMDIKPEGVSVFNILLMIPLPHPFVTFINVLSSFIISLVFFVIASPDIVVLSVPPGEPAIGFFITCKLFRKSVVFDYRDEWDIYLSSVSSASLPKYSVYQTTSRLSEALYILFKKVLTALYIKSDFVVTVTSAFQRSLKQRGVKKIHLLPNGADLTVFHPMNKSTARAKLGLSSNTFVIVYSGYIGGYYSLDVAVRALAFAKRDGLDDIKFILLGKGKRVQKVLELAETLGVAKDMSYLGLKYNVHEIVRIIASADIGLIPYDDNPLFKNTYPAKFFEYCACGIPVVATVHRDSLLARLIEETGVGLFAQPMDAESLMKAIKKMYLDTAFRRATGLRARRLIEERFDRDSIAADFLELMLNLEHKKLFSHC